MGKVCCFSLVRADYIGQRPRAQPRGHREFFSRCYSLSPRATGTLLYCRSLLIGSPSSFLQSLTPLGPGLYGFKSRLLLGLPWPPWPPSIRAGQASGRRAWQAGPESAEPAVSLSHLWPVTPRAEPGPPWLALTCLPVESRSGRPGRSGPRLLCLAGDRPSVIATDIICHFCVNYSLALCKWK